MEDVDELEVIVTRLAVFYSTRVHGRSMQSVYSS